ncbi:MAG: NADH-quinone oxidoreductase subunit M [candidate division Zixibacteria bacterium]|nr:NADH-quinone oxidoreductase subunit M [candidate division Zixibacteria bacterium]
MGFPILSLMIFTPVVGMAVVMMLNKDNFKLIRWVSTGFSIIPLILSLILAAGYDSSTSAMQFVEKASWIPSLSIQYFLGVDGLSVPMLFLTTLLSTISLIVSFNITNRVKEYFAFFLLLEAGMLGVFASLDFFLFYVFWEVMLVPMYFLIGIWGGPRKEYAAIKFFLYTLFGSIFMLVGILIMYLSTTPHTLDMMELITKGSAFSHSMQIMVWVFFFVAFAIKVPIFPFHTWLPDAHVEAPTAVSIILAGVLLKMGTYGFLRISYPMLPYGTNYFAYPFAILGLIGIIYGALVSMAQTDLKKLVAYSSVSHMGYCVLGMAVFFIDQKSGQPHITGLAGCYFQMFSHGLITGAMFLLVGVLYDRAHTREIAAFGGLGSKLPVYTAFMSVFAMASLGLPGMSGFVAEFMVFIGSFPKYPVITGLAVIGVVLTAGYILRMVQRMFLGEFNTKWSGLTEINTREIIAVTPLLLLTVALGVYPKPLITMISATLQNIVTQVMR